MTSPHPSARRVCDVAAEMLASQHLSEREVVTRVALAQNPAFWRRLVPGLSIARRPVRRPRVRHVDARALAHDLAGHGYAHFGRVFDTRFTGQLARAVERLRASDWPPVFAFLFDEFWTAPRSGRVPAFLRDAIGAGCRQSPNVWLHYVDARREASGWPPHRDHLDPGRVTMWVPITPAQVEDGCISLLPRHLLPAHLDGSWEHLDAMSRADVLRVLHAARALPADPGSIVCWRSDVLHWGGHRTSVLKPRIAFSMEFQAASADVTQDGLPLIPLTGPLPPFMQRLRLVARMVLLYYPQEPRLSRYVELAQRLAASP